MVDDSLTDKLGRTFELGPIRPPSEAHSLLIRATRNCPWNRCLFCPIYKGARFSLRSVADIREDIEAARAISDGIKEVAWRAGYGDRLREVAATLCNQPQYGPCVSHVAMWLATGGRSAFLQDSNTLIMRTPDLVEVIAFLRGMLPGLDRVTTYARSHTAARKSIAELKELRAAGLDRVHIGLETGHDPLLAYMHKGCTARHHIEGGRKIKEAGISLCEYVMPGLGGRKMSQDHAQETARVLNEINPDYIRLRSLHVAPPMALWSELQDGEFELQTDDEVVREIATFIDNLRVTSHLKSDHALNLLMEVQGKMPDDKDKCLDVISRYLSLPDDERVNFRVGRRIGLYTRLADLGDVNKRDRVDQAVKSLRARGGDVDEKILNLRNNSI
ncbi:MAG: radical SAM protein [Dehalococcoidia bacterium]|nr:radical SAM protein [Dehalococcoidia bacterium]